MLTGYILEVQRGPSWRRDGVLFWTKEDALSHAHFRLKASTVRQIRIIPVAIDESRAEQIDKPTSAHAA